MLVFFFRLFKLFALCLILASVTIIASFMRFNLLLRLYFDPLFCNIIVNDCLLNLYQSIASTYASNLSDVIILDKYTIQHYM